MRDAPPHKRPSQSRRPPPGPKSAKADFVSTLAARGAPSPAFAGEGCSPYRAASAAFSVALGRIAADELADDIEANLEIEAKIAARREAREKARGVLDELFFGRKDRSE